MERDIRRDRGQWRGCHSFKDITCDGSNGARVNRNGGLKMGQTYYYYVSQVRFWRKPQHSLTQMDQYEVDGATETHDPSLPSTTTCPYLPGQNVNTLFVPMEHSARQRSASLNKLEHADFKTMNPADKYITPRAPPPAPSAAVTRTATAPTPVLRHRRSARSLSPQPSWVWSPRRLFSRRSGDRRTPEDEESRSGSRSVRSATPPEGSRSRDISPESLRRFLVDDGPVTPEGEIVESPMLLQIPEDIVEEIDDDLNFASSAASESSMQYTGLSPPPLRRDYSSSTIVQLASIETDEHVSIDDFPAPPTRTPPRLPSPVIGEDFPQSRFSISSVESMESPNSADIPSFWDSDSEDEEDDGPMSMDDEEGGFPFPSMGRSTTTTTTTDEMAPFGRSTATLASFSGYSLPRTSVEGGDKLAIDAPAQPLRSPAILARNGNEMPVGNTSLLATPTASGLDDLVHELGWMADVISGKGTWSSSVVGGAIGPSFV